MFLNCPEEWLEFFKENNKAGALESLSKTILEHYQKEICYPNLDKVFHAFALCALSKVRVVIIGQDPYHRQHQAHGLSFSVPFGVVHPPSLKNILIEWAADLNTAYPINGDLSSWAAQGVLLLNASLSVPAGKPGTHLKDWKAFSKACIKGLSKTKTNLIFVLWGGFAHKLEPLIDTKKHEVLKTGHPSPLSANRGFWFGNRHFSKINEKLLRKNLPPIDWSL